MKIPKSEIERLVDQLHSEANNWREHEMTRDDIRRILCANVGALEEIVRLAHFLAFPPEPAPSVAERGEWTGESLCGLLVRRRYLHGCWDDRNEVERADLESLARDINAGPPLTPDAPSKP